jgi:hypothetical protein
MPATASASPADAADPVVPVEREFVAVSEYDGTDEASTDHEDPLTAVSSSSAYQPDAPAVAASEWAGVIEVSVPALTFSHTYTDTCVPPMSTLTVQPFASAHVWIVPEFLSAAMANTSRFPLVGAPGSVNATDVAPLAEVAFVCCLTATAI